MSNIVLLILDGWGLSVEKEGNAILSSPTPNFDKLMSMFPYTSLHASGEEVGLSWGEMGNSEVGHLNLGTGRVVMQDLPRINRTIQEGTFFNNPELIEAIEYAKKNNSNVHLIGLCSSGGVHSHLNHLFALLDLCKKQDFTRVYIHAITDGRDTPPKVFKQDLPKILEKIKITGIGQIASVMGRFYAMDRDKRTERTEKAYRVISRADAPQMNSAEDIVTAAYNSGQSDEFIEPIAIKGTPRINNGDTVVFFNFRSDRAKELSERIIGDKKIHFLSFTSYGFESTPEVKVAFFAEKTSNHLPAVLADANINQFHIAETEKYPHVTYFFNGGWEFPMKGEERLIVPSPKVETYDLKPEMSVKEVTENFIKYYNSKKPRFSIINFANPDMVGHTGNFKACCQAIRATDSYLGDIASKVLNSGADLIITADHGNAEQMFNLETKEIDKEHTTNPVPLILAFQDKRHSELQVMEETKIALAGQEPVGVLADIAPTILQRIGLTKPQEMTGQDLKDLI